MANTAKSVRILPDPLRSAAFGVITNGYVAIGTPLAHPARIVKFKNFTDAVIFISWDGVDDHVALAANSGDVEDETANKSSVEGMYIAEGTQFYIKYASGAPTMGSVYIEVRYGYIGS